MPLEAVTTSSVRQHHMKRKRDDLHLENRPDKLETSVSKDLNPVSLTRTVSPPPTSLRRQSTQSKSTTAQVEAGEKDVEDHLSFFSSKLLSATRNPVPKTPRIDHQSWIDLYTNNSSSVQGHHFVVHQHDHPVAGTHYDLRLQCNETSSVSWAIMYGLPGDPNSRRPTRNATETRIHCLWNHLIETASHQTGSLLIWDTGVYEVLPYREAPTQPDVMTTDEDNSDIEDKHFPGNAQWQTLSEQEKLHQSFQNRRIRLRLHGKRLPAEYTLSLWLRNVNNRFEQPAAPKTRRRRAVPNLRKQPSSKIGYNTDSDSDQDLDLNLDIDTDLDSQTTAPTQRQRKTSSLHRDKSPPTHPRTSQPPVSQTQSQPIDTEDQIRLTNAYTGAHNSINSIHQRRWFLSLDRTNSGFVKIKTTTGSGKWVPTVTSTGRSTNARPGTDAAGATRHSEGSATQTTSVSIPNLKSSLGPPGGFSPFCVLGRDHERSVVTGRLASDILADEGVVGYVPRGKWRAITE